MFAKHAAAMLLGGSMLLLSACGGDSDPYDTPPIPDDERLGMGINEPVEPEAAAPPGPAVPEAPEAEVGTEATDSVDLGDGLSYEILSDGSGTAVVEEGSRVTLATDLSLPDGTHIWSGDFPLVAGSGNAIPGYDRGIRGMRLGERRRINVPWQLGYGARGNPPDIPSRQDLVFEVELTSLENQ